MADHKYPRVGLLTYQLSMDHHHNFDPAPPLVGTLGQFSYRLEGRGAQFTPIADFPTVEAARAVLDPMLPLWRISAMLQFGGAAFDFGFIHGFVDESAEAADLRNQQPLVSLQLTTGIIIGYDQFPAFLAELGIDDCVRDLAEHYLASWLSPRGLLLHAYAMVTRVEAAHGTRKAAAAALRISDNCLGKLSRLASERGVGAGARKFTDNKPRHDLTREETNWVQQMIRLILYRSAVLAAGGTPRKRLTVNTIAQGEW
jgi:hypothetical protein